MTGIDEGQFDLAAAMRRVESIAEVTDLSFEELVRAYCVANPCNDVHYRLRKWLAPFGHLGAWALTTEQIETAAEAMRRAGYAHGSVNRDVGGIGTVYRWARRRKMAPRGFVSPTLAVPREPETMRVVEATPEEVQAIRDAALATRNRHFSAFVHLLLDTGARKSELLDRRWSEVDLDTGEITCPTTKTGRPRVLHFTSATASLVRHVRPRGDVAGRFVFEGPKGGVRDFRRPWRRLCADIGRPDLHIHDLRHVVAANLLRSGVTLPVAAQVLGHAPEVLAARYGHLETGTLREAIAKTWENAA